MTPKDKDHGPVLIKMILSVPDSAPHISPGTQRICLTFAPVLGIFISVNVSFFGSKRTNVFEPKSVIHTISFWSTYTAYGIGLSPDSFHSFHLLSAGLYIPNFPAFHSLTHILP